MFNTLLVKEPYLSDEKISEDVRTFIYSNVDSVGLIETLALLVHNKDRDWTSQQISQELRSNKDTVDHQLKRLTALGIVVPHEHDPQRYRYAPSSVELSAILEKLVDAFEIYPVRIIELIFKKPNEALRRFADAFKIRKDTEDG